MPQFRIMCRLGARGGRPGRWLQGAGRDGAASAVSGHSAQSGKPRSHTSPQCTDHSVSEK